jgi:hypothetical protein
MSALEAVKSVAAGCGKPSSATAGHGYWKAAMSTKDVAKKNIARNVHPRLTGVGDREGAPAKLGRKSVLLGMLASGFVVANAAHPSSASAGTIKPGAIGATQPAYVPWWAPATPYAKGTQIISPGNDVVSANVAHTSSTVYSADVAKWTLSRSYARDEVFVNVLTFGAKGDGTTDDTAAINAAIKASPGKVLLFPPGRTYNIVQTSDADDVGGIRLNQPGTTLSLHGAILKLATNTYSHYQMISVTAADCKVLGGRLIGDVVAHAGTAGEWGYGISVGGGGHRFVAENVYATKCWGDGFFVWGAPADVSFLNCIGDDNRRQGLSLIDAIRPRVIGGAYINTGATKYTGPGAGIDLEPDASSGRNVLDALISGVTLSGNRGAGLMSCGVNAQTTTATITGCLAVGNGIGHGLPGFWTTGSPGNTTQFLSCTASNNEAGGFIISSEGTRLMGCHAYGNGGANYVDNCSTTFAIPKPGAARPALNSSSTAAQIVAALQSLGISG